MWFFIGYPQWLLYLHNQSKERNLTLVVSSFSVGKHGLPLMGASSSSSSSSSVGPMVNATDVLQPKRIIVLTLFPRVFGRSHVCRQMPPHSPMTREILVAKGGTMWARINQKFCLRL